MEALPSASVILARQGGAALELFMVRRSVRADAFADAWVFPGGVVRLDDAHAADGSFGAADAMWALGERGGDPPGEASLALALFACAVRELFEEAGVLLARRPAGEPILIDRGDAPRWLARRQALQRDELSLAALLEAEGLRPDYRALHYFSHWITPLGSPRRFDARFFVAAMPDGQAAAECGLETRGGVWIAPTEALRQHAAADFPLVLPTRLHLERLAALRSLDELLALARTKPIATVQPTRPSLEVTDRW